MALLDCAPRIHAIDLRKGSFGASTITLDAIGRSFARQHQLSVRFAALHERSVPKACAEMARRQANSPLIPSADTRTRAG
jgi:hypothetical protein